MSLNASITMNVSLSIGGFITTGTTDIKTGTKQCTSLMCTASILFNGSIGMTISILTTVSSIHVPS